MSRGKEYSKKNGTAEKRVQEKETAEVVYEKDYSVEGKIKL